MSAITRNDYLMILALESDPLMSLKDLSRKIDVSWPTVKKRYEDVVSRGVIRTPRATTLIEEMGLNRVQVFSQVSDIQSLRKLEKASDLHPYTKYRARMIGNTIGLFSQYEIPATDIARSNLEVFLNRLQEQNIISEFSFYHSGGIRHESFPDLTRFDLDKYSWDYSWEEWFESLTADNITELPFPAEIRTEFSDFNPVRLEMLALLSENAALRQSDLMSTLDLSRTESSRQYNYVQDNFIRNIRLNYNRDAFDLTETFVFLLKEVDMRQQSILYSNISAHIAPFRFSVEILENNSVLIWGNMSMNHSNDFIYRLWDKFPNLQVWRLSTNDEGAMQYYFYPPNFDQQEKKWKDNTEYMASDPLTALATSS